MKYKLNPGSVLAIDKGCTCAVMDNLYGEGVPDGDGGYNFWISGDCPLHGWDNEGTEDHIDVIEERS